MIKLPFYIFLNEIQGKQKHIHTHAHTHTLTHTHTHTHTHTLTHTNSQEKNNSSKQYFMSSISVTFISNTGWFKVITISGIIRSLRKTSTTALDSQNLKVKDIEQDSSLIKTCCITISEQKISSFHQFNIKIQQILRSHWLKDHS